MNFTAEEKLIQGTIHEYLMFKRNSIPNIFLQLKPNKKTILPKIKSYLTELFSELQKPLHECYKCKSYSKAETIIQSYINESKEYIFNKEEYEQFNEIIGKILPALKYVIEHWGEPKQPTHKDPISNQSNNHTPKPTKNNIKTSETQINGSNIKEILKREIPVKYYKLNFQQFNIKTENIKHNLCTKYMGQNSDVRHESKAAKEIKDEFDEFFNSCILELWEENNPK